MSWRVCKAVWDCFHVEGGNVKLVLVAMADYAEHDGGSIRPSLATLATKVACSVDQARRTLRRLEQLGVVEVVSNAAGGAPGATRNYRIRVDLLTAGTYASRRPSVDAGGTDGNGARRTARTDATPHDSSTACMQNGDGLHPAPRPLASSPETACAGASQPFLTLPNPTTTPPVPPSADAGASSGITKRIFDLGTELLERHGGVKRAAARKLIGKLRSTKGDDEALRVILAAERSSDPQSFIGGAIAKRGGAVGFASRDYGAEVQKL